MNEQLTALADDLERDQQTLQRELDEIEMLLTQTAGESERAEARRAQAEERLAQIERDPSTPSDTVAEARAQVLNQTRRATLMQAQVDVLGGKQRALVRYRDRVANALPVVRAVAGPTGPGATAATAPGTPADVPSGPPPSNGSGAPPPGGSPVSGDVLAAQEQMRREIARQMHDGPAQSIANIALQAQIVQRYFERDPQRAGPELNALVAMVQQALEATKTFIFDVRPMVLDDLGLVPTLRRSTRERGRRAHVAVEFDSMGSDRRLPRDVESTVFRILDEALGAYLALAPERASLRLDWTGELEARLTAE